MKKTFSLVCILFALCCKKQADSSSTDGDHVLVFGGNSSIKIGQKINIYDSTVIHDSLSFAYPPTNRLYEWSVKPDNGTVFFSGNYQYGIGNVLFTRAGDYSISAEIFDSATHKRVGTTRPIGITVSTDTLHATQAIDRNDSLSIDVVQFGSASRPIAAFGMSTAKEYDYGHSTGFDMKVTDDPATLFLVFSDSVRLQTYPFAYGTTRSQVYGNAFIGCAPGESQQLNITWLDKTYYGTLKTDSSGKISVAWQNGVISFH
jgi:hypothetical protein